MRRGHLRLVVAGEKAPPHKRTRPRKSIMSEIEDLSEYHDMMRQDYKEEFTTRETLARLLERIDTLTREILARPPRSAHEAVDIGKIVAENSYGSGDQSAVIAAARRLSTFYGDLVSKMERWAACRLERHDTE